MREFFSLDSVAMSAAPTSAAQPATPATPGGGGEAVPIRAPASLWRCSRIMHLLRDLHPTLLSALEGIVDQVCALNAHTYTPLLIVPYS